LDGKELPNLRMKTDDSDFFKDAEKMITSTRRHSDRIDKMIKIEALQKRGSLKFYQVLLLGSLHSGKSTIIKQLKIKYSGGFTEQERLRYKSTILVYIVEIFVILVEANPIKKNSIEYDNAVSILLDTHEQLDELEDGKDGFLLTEKIGMALQLLSEDSQIRLTLFHQWARIELPDSTGYFMDNISRILEKDYLPSNEGDINCLMDRCHQYKHI
jgi:hypothetical protein